jgi:hypothetical protein
VMQVVNQGMSIALKLINPHCRLENSTVKI